MINITDFIIKNGLEPIGKFYNFFVSKTQLSDARKEKIKERRAQLKVEKGDPLVLQIIVEEMLSYKPIFLTLDDRYLQLEQILDAIDKAKLTKQTTELVNVCENIAKDLAASPGKIKNALLEVLATARSRILATDSKIPTPDINKIRAKL